MIYTQQVGESFARKLWSSLSETRIQSFDRVNIDFLSQLAGGVSAPATIKKIYFEDGDIFPPTRQINQKSSYVELGSE